MDGHAETSDGETDERNDDSGNHGMWGTDPALHDLTGLTPGADYLLQIDGFNGSQGSGMILVEGVPAPCPCDWNHNNVLNSQDFFDFISCFFTVGCDSDFNQDHVLNSHDFFDFITCFFAPPAACP